MIIGFCTCSVADVDEDVLLGDRVETDNAALERLIELDVLLLRAFHVHNVCRVVVRLKHICKHCTSCVVFVQGVDERQVNYMSIFVLIEAASCESYGTALSHSLIRTFSRGQGHRGNGQKHQIRGASTNTARPFCAPTNIPTAHSG